MEIQKIKKPETINEFLDERISFWKTFPTDHPKYEDCKMRISKALYCKSLDENALEYREVVNSIIDVILKKNYEDFPIDAPPAENIGASTMEMDKAVISYNETIKDIHDWCKAIEKLKIVNKKPCNNCQGGGCTSCGGFGYVIEG